MITLVETSQFATKADKIMSAVEKDDLFDFIARNPKAGDIISGTGGVRKLRFAIREKANEEVSGLFITFITTGIRCSFSPYLAKTKGRI